MKSWPGVSLAFASVMIVTLAGVAGAGSAEPRFEITPFAGYEIGGRIEVEEGDLTLGDGPAWGGGFGYHVFPDLVIEAFYARQQGDLGYDTASFSTSQKLFEMRVHQIQAGVSYEHGLGTVRPIIGGGMGAAIFDPVPEDLADETRFSFNIHAGTRIYMSEVLGLRLQARGYFVSAGNSAGEIFCNEDFCYLESGGSLISQFEFTAGLIIRL